MSDLRLKLRVSSFHKKLMDQQMGVISAEKKESGVISIDKEMKEVHLEQKDIKTPKERISGFRNIESLLENPKNRENREETWNKHRINKIDNEYVENDEKEEECNKQFIMKEEDIPELMNNNLENKEEKINSWSGFNKNINELQNIGNEINRITREKYDKEVIENYNKMLIANDTIMREQRLEDFIKKVKKNYEKEYIVYDIDAYIEDELRYYVDEDDMTDEYILYEEMLEETRNRDIELDKLIYDNDEYYKYYDEEAKYYIED